MSENQQLPDSSSAIAVATFENPHIDAARTKNLLGISDPTARKTLAVLEKAGLISETTGRTWGRQFLARGVLAAIEDPGEAEQSGQ